MNSINQFWNRQNASLNRDSSDEFYKKKASEHRNVMSDSDAQDGILDLGCGAGELLIHLSRLAKIDIGVDYSLAMIKAAQQRLDGQFFGLLLQVDIFSYLPSAKQTVWTTTGAINQYLDADQMSRVLDMFVDNDKVRSFYLFDCIDPLRYDLVSHSISYRQKHILPLKLIPAFKKYIKQLIVACGLIFNRYSKDVIYLGKPSMGYGQRPAFWLRNGVVRDLNVEIISSRYYEYRYHVVIRK
jgi:SAM-dependent methyltransferase